MELYMCAYGKKVKDNLQDIIHEKCFGCMHDCPSQRDHDMCLMTPYTEQLDACLTEAINRSTGFTNYLEVMVEFIGNARQEFCYTLDSKDDGQRYGVLDVLNLFEFHNLIFTREQSSGEWLKKVSDFLLGQEIHRQNTTPQCDLDPDDDTCLADMDGN